MTRSRSSALSLFPRVAAVLLLALLALLPTTRTHADPPPLSPKAALGKALFNDATLSTPVGQSCASCHNADAAFAFPDSYTNMTLGVAPGAVAGRFGRRTVPPLGYAAFAPDGPFYSYPLGMYVGGFFRDGRASSLTDQVHFPLTDPNEMNNRTNHAPDVSLVVQKVAAGPSAQGLKDLYGADAFSQPPSVAMGYIADAIAEYERSHEVSPFSSKYDAWRAGKAELTPSELNGLRLVTGSWTGRPGGAAWPRTAHCVECHAVPAVPSATPDLWTAYCYQNIGVPRNTTNPFYTQTDAVSNPDGYNPDGENYVDYGLGEPFYTGRGLPRGNVGPGSDGRGDFWGVNGTFKAPTLRNINKRPSPDFVKAYTHNGAFTSIASLVHFYNTRNLTTEPGEVIDFTKPNPYQGLKGTPLWPEPEISSPESLVNAEGMFGMDPNQGPGEPSAIIGNLGMTPEEEADIVAFLKTLTDGYFDPYEGWTCVTVTTQPVSQVVALYADCTFAMSSSDPSPLSYQWRHDGVPIDGETHSFYTITTATTADIGDYDCVVVTSCGSVTTVKAHLDVCAGDFNGDGQIDIFDYVDFVTAFDDGDLMADVNGDEFLDVFDFTVFVTSFESGC